MKETTFESITTLTRPADTTAYAAGDAITDSTSAPTPLEFTRVCGSNGRTIIIRNIVIAQSGANVAALQLHLFKKSPTATNDNSAFDVSAADNLNSIGYIELTGEGSTSSSVLITGAIAKQFKLEPDTTSVYGLLKVKEALTPISAETFTITLSGSVRD